MSYARIIIEEGDTIANILRHSLLAFPDRVRHVGFVQAKDEYSPAFLDIDVLPGQSILECLKDAQRYTLEAIRNLRNSYPIPRERIWPSSPSASVVVAGDDDELNTTDPCVGTDDSEGAGVTTTTTTAHDNNSMVVQSLYKSAALQSTSMQERAHGHGIVMKKYHNHVKLQLIRQMCRRDGVLWDVGCGRGGDIFKWTSVPLAHVLAIDISPDSLREARRRWNNVRTTTTTTTHIEWRLTTDWITDPLLSPAAVRNTPYANPSAISCMFALQYFCSSREALRAFLKRVVDHLPEGGVFFGTAPVAHAITPLWSRQKAGDPQQGNDDNGEKLQFSNSIFQVTYVGGGRSGDHVTIPSMGRACRFMMKDTVTDATTDGSMEYLVWPQLVEDVALEVGLCTAAVNAWDDSVQACLDMSSARHGFVDFRPDISSMGQDWAEASRCFAAFAYRKVVGTSSHLPSRLPCAVMNWEVGVAKSSSRTYRCPSCNEFVFLTDQDEVVCKTCLNLIVCALPTQRDQIHIAR